MSIVTQPLRDEHAELFPHVESMRIAADAIGERPPVEVAAKVAEVVEFLSRQLIPHATAEEEALYPVVDKLLGAPGATASMSLDHVEVGRLSGVLKELKTKLDARQLTQNEVQELRMALYGLYVLVKLHFHKEEVAYLPLLDQKLTPEAARAMFEAMEAAAARAKKVTPS